MRKKTSIDRFVFIFLRVFRPFLGAFFVIALVQMTWSIPSLYATEFLLKDGRTIRGTLAVTTGIEEKPKPLQKGYWQPILCVDDQLRRVFFSKRLVKPKGGVLQDVETSPEKFRIWQKPRRAGGEVVWVGPTLKATKFDKFGRRTLTFRGLKGPVDVHQGITDLTPYWGKAMGISHVWDMRISPASIPTDTLYEILKHQSHSSEIDHTKKIARFFIQMERYEKSLEILEELVKKHPETREDIELSIKQLRRLSTQRLLRELKLRADAGQNQLVWNLLNQFLREFKKFPVESIPAEVLQEVRQMIASCENAFLLRKQLLDKYDQLVEKISGEEDRKVFKEIGEELRIELNQNTLRRLAAFRLAASDEEMPASEKLALATAGWVLGSDGAVADLTTAISVYEIREMIRQYLVEDDAKKRERMLLDFSSKQAATPKLVDQILKHLKPPVPSTPVEGKPGYFELELDGLEKGTKIPYVVQLPPEYDPHKTYPTILALHNAGSEPEDEIVWWAGRWTKKGIRHGQATRHGYIVIAPAWIPENQKTYKYSAHAHAAVMWTLRDAMRRFSIDTDRVFLTGHAVGGEAAWDIGLAHPGLWAGVIPISMRGDRYVRHYWENAKLVPFYFVGGQYDGNWIDDNAQQFNRYIKHGYNTTVVEYRGRGHEPFYDEILKIFEWMSHFKRDFYPRKINCVSMRPWDNYFWWIELSDLPQATMINPDKWATIRNMIPMRTEARVLPNNGIIVKTGAAKTIVWLSPKLVDFDRPIPITVNGKRLTRRNQKIAPSVKVMLEDARTRCNRQEVFWAKVETN